MASEDMLGRVIVITGASSGIGKGTARQLAGAGASLVLAARREELLTELAHECEELGGQAIAVPTDVSAAGEVQRLTKMALAHFGKIDTWINDAGVGAIGRFEVVPLADHIRVIETNLHGTLFGSYCAMRLFRRQGYGTIINIASALGKVPAPYQVSYTASKYAIVGLDAALRQELHENHVENIHVCTVLPMATDTPFFEHASNYTGHEAVPIAPLYDPQRVIDVIVKLVTTPQDEVIVGTVGKLAAAAHNIAPGLTESLMARQVHRSQIENAPSANISHGSLHKPMPTGTGVSGGRLARVMAATRASAAASAR